MSAYFPTVVALFAFYIALPIFTHTMYLKAISNRKISNGVVVCVVVRIDPKKNFFLLQVSSYTDMCLENHNWRENLNLSNFFHFFFYTFMLKINYLFFFSFSFFIVTDTYTQCFHQWMAIFNVFVIAFPSYGKNWIYIYV